MKIKELHLRNIASIERADIDFENGLNDALTNDPAGVFLITGDTGSGKSVLLDGISMALYKKTPRTEGVANVKNNAYTNDQGDSVNINSIQQYTRLGISNKDESYSELVFEGNDGRVYRARLTLGLSRSNKDADGRRRLKYRDPLWEVREENEDWKKVDSRTGEPISTAVGLTFEQFGRMAMLAQGQFASFLTGAKSEREEILEQLTDTARFSTCGKAITNLYNSAKTVRDNARTAYDTEKSHTLEQEKVQELNDRRSVLVREKSGLDKESLELRSRLESVKGLINTLAAKKESEARKTELETLAGSEEYNRNKALVLGWDRTNSERQTLASKKAAAAQRAEAESLLPRAEECFNALTSDLYFRKIDIQKKAERTKLIEDLLEDGKPLDEVYTKAETVCLQLEQFKDNTAGLSSARASLSDEIAKTQGLQQALSDAYTEVKEAEKAVSAKQSSIDRLTAERNELNPSAISEGIKNINRRRNNLDWLQKRIGLQEDRRAELKKHMAEIEGAGTKLQEISEELGSARKRAEEKSRIKEDAVSLLITMQMSMDETISALRTRLIHDRADTCPLCGQHIGSIKIDKDFDGLLSPLRQKEKLAKEEWEAAAKALEEATRRYDTLKGSIDTKLKDYENNLAAVTTEDDRIVSDALKLGFEESQDIAGQIAADLLKTSAELAGLEAKQKKAEDLQKDILRLIDEKRPLDTALAESGKKHLRARLILDKNAGDIKNLESSIASLEKINTELHSTLSGQLEAAYPSWSTDTETVKARLKHDADTYCARKKAVQDLRTEIEKAEQEVKSIEETRGSIVSIYPLWDTTAKAAGNTGVPSEWRQGRSANIHKEWADLLAEARLLDGTIARATATITRAEASLEAYYKENGTNEEELEKLSVAEASVTKARAFVNDIGNRMKSSIDSIDACNIAIKAHMEKLGIEKAEEAPSEDALIRELQSVAMAIEKNVAETGAIDDRLRENSKNVSRLNKAKDELERASGQLEKWDRLNKIFGGSRFRTLVQTHILRPLLNNANIYLEKITDRYTLTCSTENENLSILVLDRYNKNQLRSATVLSGGERFMISLALSLALSSLNRQDMNINILFIDEGFGTLDETSLDSVMSTLEKLREIAGQSKRRVGIISHREELAERIPVKIRVIKKGEGRSIVELPLSGYTDD